MARDLETRVLKGHTPVSARALLKRWPVNSMPLCRNPVAQRGRPSQLLQAQEREGAVDKGSGPLDQRSTKQLKSDLAKGELAPRKKSFVHENSAQTSRGQSWGSIAKVCVARRHHHSVWLSGGCLNTIGQPCDWEKMIPMEGPFVLPDSAQGGDREVDRRKAGPGPR